MLADFTSAIPLIEIITISLAINKETKQNINRMWVGVFVVICYMYMDHIQFEFRSRLQQ